MPEPGVFIIGDYRSPTGPARVTKAYIDALKKDGISFTYLESASRPMRFMELIFKIPLCDVALFSGYSRQNLIGMSLAGLSGRPTIYLMHGSVDHENEINKVPDPRMAKNEYKMMQKCTMLLAVSKQFEGWLKDRYPEFRGKISHLTNGVDWESLAEKREENAGRDENAIISIGGGMPRKRIVRICEAVDILRKDTGRDIRLTVIGDKGYDTEKIASYPFVTDMGMVDSGSVASILSRHRIFIQDSCFETFGLAPLEALACGCDILLSRECGCLEVLNDVLPEEVIEDPDNVEEIVTKLKALMEDHNNERLYSAVDINATCWNARIRELLEICRKLVKEKGR